MKWKTKKGQDPEEWHVWFAWHPVRVEDNWVWREEVMRKQYMGRGPGKQSYSWKYTNKSPLSMA